MRNRDAGTSAASDLDFAPPAHQSYELQAPRSGLTIIALLVALLSVAGGIWFFKFREPGLLPEEVMAKNAVKLTPVPEAIRIEERPVAKKPAKEAPVAKSSGPKTETLFGMLASSLKTNANPSESAAGTDQPERVPDKTITVPQQTSDSGAAVTKTVSSNAAATPANRQEPFSTREAPITIDLGEDAFSTGGSGGMGTSRPNSAQADSGLAPPMPAGLEARSGSVVPVNEGTFNAEVLAHGSSTVLVDFYATWCGPCKMLAPRIDQAAREYGGKLKVVKLDIDQCKDIARRYRVNSFPTLVFFKGGRESGRITGALTLDHLRATIDKHI
jgi:thioredoxin 1